MVTVRRDSDGVGVACVAFQVEQGGWVHRIGEWCCSDDG